MVLNHVPDDPILVKVATAALCAKVFTEYDLGAAVHVYRMCMYSLLYQRQSVLAPVHPY